MAEKSRKAGSSAKKSSRSKASSSSSKNNRCWAGYEPTPGKEPYSKGSCRKKGK